MNIDPANYTPFAPNGFTGIHQGAAIVFFAYIGFDAISTAAEETQNPQRNLPIGILGGLAICTAHLRRRRRRADRAWCRISSWRWPIRWRNALELAGLRARRLDRRARRGRLDVGRAARVPVRPAAHLLRDGARRPAAAVGRARRSEGRASRTSTTLVTGVVVALASLIGDAAETYDLTNIGTLFAFALVCAGVLVLRVQGARRPRPFRVPFVWVVAPLGVAACLFVMVGLPRAGVGALRHLARHRARDLRRLRLPAQPAARRAIAARELHPPACTQSCFASAISRSPASVCWWRSARWPRLIVFQRELPRASLPEDAINAAVAGVVGGLAGAKVDLAIEFRHTAPFLDLLFSRGGLSWFGGFAGGLTVGLLSLHFYGVPLVRGLAAASPALALGHAIGRVGCFFVGDDYGRPSTLPWAVAFPKGLPPTDVRVHPTQLYETAALVILAWWLRVAPATTWLIPWSCRAIWSLRAPSASPSSSSGSTSAGARTADAGAALVHCARAGRCCHRGSGTAPGLITRPLTQPGRTHPTGARPTPTVGACSRR